MKKILFVIIMAFAVNLGFAAEKESAVVETIEQVKEVAEEGKNAVATVYDDTKSIVTTVYGDGKEVIKDLAPKIESAVAELAKGLKVGAEEVFGILVKKQIADSVTYLLVCIIFIISIIGLIKTIKIGIKNDWEEHNIVTFCLTGFCVFVLAIISMVNLQEMIRGFIVPEYGAIKEVVDMAQGLMNKNLIK